VGGSSGIAVARPSDSPSYIHGASTAWMKFPAGILPSAQYTLFYVARYTGQTRRRIFQGQTQSDAWISGFHGNRAGGAYHGGCGWTPSKACGSTCFVDLHDSDWVVGSDRSDSFRSNGVNRHSSDYNGCSTYDRLAINAGNAPGETSDFAIQSVLVYNVKLSDSDVQRVEAFLSGNQSCAAGQAFSFATFSCSPCSRG
jgi:hypothetical protein